MVPVCNVRPVQRWGDRMRDYRGSYNLVAGLAYTGVLTISLGALAKPGPPPAGSEQLSEIVIEAPEPRFVAPTRRDKIGRIWAPVMINDQGPFSLVLDTGANRSAVNARVAQVLGISPDATQSVLLRGVTGNVAVPTIRVSSFCVGDMIMTPAILPIVTDALGGADGVLGTEGFADKRLYIDFKHDLITITRSHGERSLGNFSTLPLERSAAGLLVVRASVAGVRVHAIIDTGGQATIGNEALRQALMWRRTKGAPSEIVDVTTTSQSGESFPSPPIELGSIQIQGARVTYGNMQIFDHWHLTQEPALLIGMDAIGLLDVFVIDYRRHELQLRTRPRGV
jgi:predicted aspartyl protease